MNTKLMLTGDICKDIIDPGLIQSEQHPLTAAQREFLWKLFVQIGNVWENVHYESSNLKSSWLEMVAAKTNVAPSYTGEYINATYVIQELIDLNGEENAYRLLFLTYKQPEGPPTTRLAHTKAFVVNEFIIMQVMASGFKHFGGKNYHGYVKGSRYSKQDLVRVYKPDPATNNAQQS
ncbi:hypothetical protein SAMN05421820_10413 [Pedobacter steynii]|uniref:Uncharacterized protein n=1 Tax=Pedobacter steynii TaxID=430522 RepID=A0A1G9TZD1_9SPHI|nr:hypothetical protein [Pedobacter steynii]NQX40611.1 hypothetical protein [Pedobacter steynii]SDM53099.1 hypothetical protein SAMN05421820_10413 [Pedobacter steynii]